MVIVHEIDLDLQNSGQTPRIQVKQGEVFSRQVAIRLYAGGEPWQIPEGESVVIRYHGPCGEGLYDTLPNGAAAWQAEGNILTVHLAPQMMTCHGVIQADVLFVHQDYVLATANFEIYVNLAPAAGTEPTAQNYYNVTTLEQINEKFLTTDAWIERIDKKTVNKSGDYMTGDLSMGNCRITHLAMPENDSDAVNRAFLDFAVGDAVGVLMRGIPDEFTRLINDRYELVEMAVTDSSGNTRLRKVLAAK